jgi:hypothetical protein
MWLDYVEETLGELLLGPDPPSAAAEISKSMAGYIADWRHAAGRTDPFVWTGDAEPLTLERLLLYWLNLAQFLGDRSRAEGKSRAPAAVAPISRGVIAALLDALESEGGDFADHARLMRQRWPS